MSGPMIRRDSFYAHQFWRRVKKRKDGCWVWTRALDSGGYGVAHVRVNGQVLRSAHRAAYTLEKGPIPEGLHIDHLCRVRHCVNPEHLEAVTPAENNRRIPRAASPRKSRAIRVEDELWEAAQRAADEQRHVLSEQIRKFLERYVEDNNKRKGEK